MTAKKQQPSRRETIETLRQRVGTFRTSIRAVEAEHAQAQSDLESGDAEALERITLAGSRRKALSDALQAVTARLSELEREQAHAEEAAAHKQTMRELASYAKDATLALSDLIAAREEAGEALAAAVADILTFGASN
jgi:DNA repair exonuclease SbcCD ATPase subunit